MNIQTTDNLVGAKTSTAVTVFSDASFCPKTKAAGWGAWAKRDGWENGRFYGGPLRREMPNCTIAELCGAASVFWFLGRQNTFVDVDWIMLQCDSIAALSAIHTLPSSIWSRGRDAKKAASIARRKKPFTALEREALDAIDQAVSGRRLVLRHIKGHQNETSQHWVNNQCDAEARRHMQAMRLELSSGSAK